MESGEKNEMLELQRHIVLEVLPLYISEIILKFLLDVARQQNCGLSKSSKKSG